MIRLTIAGPSEREAIYRARHTVYAKELGQHHSNPEGRLTDALDPHNEYIAALDSDGTLLGFVSLTSPQAPRYSLDKYFVRTELPFPVDNGLWEVRLLTVLSQKRGSGLAFLLMYAALRWVQNAGGTRIAGIGRKEVKKLYIHAGLAFHGLEVRSGAVTYELMSATVPELAAEARHNQRLLQRLQPTLTWELPFPFGLESCFHGGAFFHAIGTDFAHLEKRQTIINADVLDAWFEPAPEVTTALTEHLPWLLRTSPPTQCEGLIAAIAASQNVPEACLAVGAGSSDLIFRALPYWLSPASRVLLPDPAYGEYAHVLERVIGCTVERLPLSREKGWRLPLDLLAEKLVSGNFDLCILIHPNNPTGTLTSSAQLTTALQAAPRTTRLWIDEAYIDYVGREHSLEPLAATSPNVVVCKSLSKAYALSGARVAYLCGPEALMAQIRQRTPPWQVSLLAQVAAVRALSAQDYYHARWQETHGLRSSLAQALRAALPQLTLEESVANWLTAYLPQDAPTAATVCQQAAQRGLFIRDLSRTSTRFGPRALRIAVKEAAMNKEIIAVLTAILQGP